MLTQAPTLQSAMASSVPAPPLDLPGQPEGSRASHVDGLRGIAALWVVLFHVRGGGHLPTLIAAMPAWMVDVFFQAGELGVDIFFVLSGFVMALVVDGKAFGTRNVLPFLGRRLVRLSPPLYFSMAAVLAFAWLKSRTVGGEFLLPSLTDVLAQATYLHGFFQVPLLNGVYWTLGIEVQFYVVFALLMAGITALVGPPRVDALRAQMGFVLLVFASLWPLGVLTGPGWTGGFLPYWYAFWLGACIRWRAHLGVCLPVAVALFLVCDVVLGNGSLVVAAITGWLLLEGTGTSALRAALASRVVLFVGTVSYSLYLLHPPVTGAAFNLAHRLLPHTVAGETVALGVVIVSCVAAAYVGYRLVEMPSMRWSKRVR